MEKELEIAWEEIYTMLDGIRYEKLEAIITPEEYKIKFDSILQIMLGMGDPFREEVFVFLAQHPDYHIDTQM